MRQSQFLMEKSSGGIKKKFESIHRCRCLLAVGVFIFALFIVEENKNVIELNTYETKLIDFPRKITRNLHENLGGKLQNDQNVPSVKKKMEYEQNLAEDAPSGFQLYLRMKSSKSNSVSDVFESPESDDTNIHAMQNTSVVTMHQKKKLNTSHSIDGWGKEKLDLDNLLFEKIVAWPYCEYGLKSSESLHTIQNGVRESAYLEFETNMFNLDQNVVWLGDIIYPFQPNALWCEEFYKRVAAVKEFRAKHGLFQQWPIHIIDFADGHGLRRCENIENLVGSNFVFYHKRAMVYHRMWDEKKNWVNPGKYKASDIHGRLELPVRTDIIEETSRVLGEKYNLSLKDHIESVIQRPIDVAHFWALDNSIKSELYHLRSRVSRIIDDLHNTTEVNAFIGEAGQKSKTGRNVAQTAYIEKMLDSKIVVVSQPDRWEGHYRLFEALVSGAMVMTDRILDMPEGIVNGTSIVEYSSKEDLHSKILYYLRHPGERIDIAHRGRFVAMNQHRTWHRIEDVIFGKPMTTCTSNRTTNSDCPWIVHTNEGSHSPLKKHDLSKKAAMITNLTWCRIPFTGQGERGHTSPLFKAFFFHFCPRALEAHPEISKGDSPDKNFLEFQLVRDFPPNVYCDVNMLNSKLNHDPFIPRDRSSTTFATISDPLDRLAKSFSDRVRFGLRNISTVEEFMHDARIPNCQTKMLLGYPCFKAVEPAKLNISLAVERIKSNNFFFGVTYRWYETICLFHNWYGGSIQIHELHDNWVTPTLPIKKDLMNYSDMDTILFDYAVEIFDKRLKKAGCLIHDRNSSLAVL